MPTYEASSAFWRDYRQLTPAQQVRFQAALLAFIADLRAVEAGRRTWFRPGLRVRKLSGASGVFEMSWAPDGRGMFSWGDPVVKGRLHVVWHRCGTHDIFP